MKMFKPVIASIFIILTGCGGDDSSSSTPTNSTGVFLDGPVVNIGYRTETKQGVTNASGEYDYLPGESVTFFIGDLEFPTVQASGVVTPLELAGTTDTSDPTVVNMIRLLQTLDENADHSDGIQISEEAIAAATQVEFNLTVAEFEASQAVTALLTNLSIPALISEAEAIQNFEDTLDESYSVNLTEITASSLIAYSGCPGVVGGWDYSFTATDMTVVGTDSWDSSCLLGAEETITVPMLTLAADFDVPFNCESYPICTSDDFNKVISSIDEDDRSFTSTYSFDRESSVLTYTKVTADSTYTEVITWNNSIVGSWLVSTDGGQAVITFFADGSYVHAEDGTNDLNGEDGMERGSYTWDASTGAFATTCPTVDTNGEWGLSHGGGGLTCDGSTADGTSATVTIDGNTLVIDGADTASRVIGIEPIVGSWLFATDGGQAVITFFADGSYVHAEDGTNDPNGVDGMERGSYTWDASTGAFATTCPTVDTNGEWGLSHGGGGLTCSDSTADGTNTTVTIDSNTLTLGGTTTADRVVP